MHLIRPWLYTGTRCEINNQDLINTHQIDAVLQLAEESKCSKIASLCIPVEEGITLPVDLLKKGIDFVIEQKEQGHIILISCKVGTSRSATLAAAVLKEVEGLSLLDALKDINHRLPRLLPHPSIWESICTYYQEDISIYDLTNILHDQPQSDLEI